MLKFIAIVLMSLFGCSGEPERLKLIEINPTSYKFDSGLEEVSESIESNFRREKFKHMDLYSKNRSIRPLDSIDIFQQPKNQNDYFLSPTDYYFTIGKSKVYPENEYVASFHLHLIAVDSNHTEVRIVTINPRIINGLEFFPKPPHFVRPLKYLEVEPSTIEEYEILLIIGKSLGQAGMPDIKLPNP